MSSYWLEYEGNIKRGNHLDSDMSADVCIIGAGICGLTTGYYLAKSGLKIIIIDKDDIGKKVSGNTTAKITLQHGLIYDYLINSYGKEFALGYFEANRKAITNIKEIIDKENIECDFEYQPNFVYTTHKNETEKIKKEVDSINLLARYRKRLCKIYNQLPVAN